MTDTGAFIDINRAAADRVAATISTLDPQYRTYPQALRALCVGADGTSTSADMFSVLVSLGIEIVEEYARADDSGASYESLVDCVVDGLREHLVDGGSFSGRVRVIDPLTGDEPHAGRAVVRWAAPSGALVSRDLVWVKVSDLGGEPGGIVSYPATWVIG